MSTAPKNLLKINKLLDAFLEKFFVQWPIDNLSSRKKDLTWGLQYREDGNTDVSYDYIPTKFTRSRLIEHFSGKKIRNSVYKRDEGAYGFRLAKNNRVKTFCIDSDKPESMVALHDKILPKLDELNIEYLFEYGGYNKDRAHVWIFCETTEVEILTAFVDKIFFTAGVDRKITKFELFGTHLSNSLIRLFGGYHLRSESVNPMLFRGVESNDPVFMLKSAIACRQVTQEQMLDYVGAGAFDDLSSLSDTKGILRNADGTVIRRKRSGPKYFIEQKLPYKFDDGQTEPYAHRLFSECQAINRLLKKVESDETQERFLDTPGEAHRPGLFLGGIFKTGEKLHKNSPEESQDYRSAAERFYDTYRMRDPSSHGWQHEGDDRTVFTSSCEKWEAELDECAGCPHKGREGFTNPHRLWTMKPLKVVKEAEIPSASAEDIAKKIWQKANKIIAEAIDNGQALKMVIKSPQQTYKTTNVCRTSAKLAGAGYNILTLVPTGQIAKEIYERLKQKGVESYLLMSHKNLFKYFKELKKILHDCPDAEDIQMKQDLGVSRKNIVKEHCRGCEWKDECPFPNQYRNLATTSKKIVIAQHAHMAVDSVTTSFATRQFDLTFVDETFVDSMFGYYKCTKEEIEVFEKYQGFPWMPLFLKWLQGGTLAKKKIHPSKSQLKKIRESIQYYELPWHFRHYLQSYNDGEIYRKREGILVFNPWPRMKRLVMTNATAPVQLTTKLLGLDTKMKVLGGRELVNCKLYNPRNEMIKILDSSTSVTAMSDTVRLDKILNWIGLKAQSDWRGLTILVTTYSSSKHQVEMYFKEYFPREAKRIQVANMAVGTNEWRDTNVQVLLAGVHFNTLDLKKQAWKYKTGINYWREQNDMTPIHNSYPYGISQEDGSWVTDREVAVNLLGADGKAHKVVFPQLLSYKPVDEYESMVDWMSLGQTQQADRIRTFDKKLKIFVDFSNRYRPSLLFTKVVFLDQLLAEMGIQ